MMMMMMMMIKALYSMIQLTLQTVVVVVDLYSHHAVPLMR